MPSVYPLYDTAYLKTHGTSGTTDLPLHVLRYVDFSDLFLHPALSHLVFFTAKVRLFKAEHTAPSEVEAAEGLRQITSIYSMWTHGRTEVVVGFCEQKNLWDVCAQYFAY